MSSLPHLPALRLGRAYASLDQVETRDCRTGAPVAHVSQVNAGIIRKDMAKIGQARAALKKFTCAQLIAMTTKAADLFLNGTLPLGDKGHTQTPQQYIETLCATSGLPHVLIRRNMTRIHTAMSALEGLLRGLTRGLDLSVIDTGTGTQAGCPVSYFAATQSLGLVMPSNSPAVNSLWLPSIALKIPVVLKPGREEPWTPYRLIQAFIAAGVPAEAFGFYPTDHEGAGEILKLCGRALIFGDKATTQIYANNPAIQIHGPGYSKVIIGEDQVDRWPEFLDILVDSVSANSGRSCLCASTIVVPRHAAEIAEALAQRLAPIAPSSVTDEHARLAGFANPKMADFINSNIDEGLKTPGAEDVTARHRTGPRLVQFEGGVFVRPTIVRCDSFAHPLANKEYLFPYAAVVTCPQAKMLEQIGPSLVVTAITRDEAFISQVMECHHVDRLNIGPVSTMKISWDQPHEGNLFEFLYTRRAIQRGW
jgi:hypothetical protein